MKCNMDQLGLSSLILSCHVKYLEFHRVERRIEADRAHILFLGYSLGALDSCSRFLVLSILLLGSLG